MPDAPKPTFWPIATLVAFGVILVMPLCSFQVRTTELAVKTTFGKLDPTPIPAGLHWKLPWPIQKVHTFDKRMRVFASKSAENYTADGKNLVLTLFTAWQIEKPSLFLDSVGTSVDAERALSDLITSSKNEVVARHPVSDFITTDPKQLKFDAIQNEIAKDVTQKAMDKYGIRVSLLGIEQVALPEETTQAVFARMKAERNNKAKLIDQDATLQANKITSEASTKSSALVASAQADAKEMQGKGDAAAAEVYNGADIRTALAKPENMEFALFLRKLEALEETLSKKTTIVVDRDIPPFDLLRPNATQNLGKDAQK